MVFLFQMLVKKYADEAARAAAEAERFRQSKASEMNRKLQQMKEERRKREAQGMFCSELTLGEYKQSFSIVSCEGLGNWYPWSAIVETCFVSVEEGKLWGQKQLFSSSSYLLCLCHMPFNKRQDIHVEIRYTNVMSFEVVPTQVCKTGDSIEITAPLK